VDNWNEIKSAYFVAKLGTVSAASEALGVHRATIIRHIDTLEAEVGHKIFQRHGRGYTPTDVGADLMRVAETVETQFDDFLGRTHGKSSSLSGEFIITSLQVNVPTVMPLLNIFKAKNPDVVVRYKVDTRVLRLEYGEAHAAIRVGAKPEDPDCVVQHFTNIRFALYASSSYVEKNGIPESQERFEHHSFIGIDRNNVRAPFHRWMELRVPESSISFRSTSAIAAEEAVLAGLGIGFLPVYRAQQHQDLRVVAPYQRPWDINCWLVTHVDLHRSAKVQAFLQVFKSAGDPLRAFNESSLS